jgi:hypothetical protein
VAFQVLAFDGAVGHDWSFLWVLGSAAARRQRLVHQLDVPFRG